MNLEERVLAAKAKLEEAVDELLELVSDSPENVEQILGVARPERSGEGADFRHYVHTEWHRDGAVYRERFRVPNVFFETSKRGVRHEKDRPKDCLVPEGEVYVLVGIRPENEERTRAIRELTDGVIDGAEYQLRMTAVSEAEEYHADPLPADVFGEGA